MMVDPRRSDPGDPKRRERGHGDDGTHPATPSVGGPTPDPRTGNPQPVKVRNRWTIGIAIAILAAAAIIFLVWYWTTGAVEEAAVGPDAPPVAAVQVDRPAARPGDCRTFTQEVTVAGESRTLNGTACMQADGSWRIVAPD